MNEFQISLTADDLNVIGQLLGQAPWSVANPLIQKLNQQVQDQQTMQGIVEENRE